MRRKSITLNFAVLALLGLNQLLIAQSTRNPDFDANGIVDFGDFVLFAQAFGSEQSNFDLDGNGIVDFPDFILFAEQFGEGVPQEDVTVTLPGGAKLEMVWIEPGRFLMGSPDSEPGRYDDEGPQHQVTITKGFYLGKYEVTRAQWESVMNTRPWDWAGTFEDPEKSKYPAVNMAWRAVETFILRLNESEGKELFRLPTEAEWEYACRAGTTTRWSFGEDSTRIADYARYIENSRMVIVRDDGSIAYGSPEAQETGGVFPNPWGLYDMHGNAREWVQSFYGPYSAQPQIDPKGPEWPTEGHAPENSYVSRGGAYNDRPRSVRSAVRYRAMGQSIFTGFRVVMEHR